MKIARIDQKSKIVVNLEICEPEWLIEDENINSKEFLFVDNEDGLAEIGGYWDGEYFLPK